MKFNHRKDVDRLFEAILTLKDIHECYAFFEDICTAKELNEIAQRFEVAEYLNDGKSYNEINLKTGASTATICRVKKCLFNGSDGYLLALNRLSNQEVSL